MTPCSTRRVAPRIAWLCVFVLGLIAARPVSAGNGGEARSVLREPDRPYGVVAGEADASAVVQNPANLAFLDGLSAIFDFAFAAAASGRRGDGLGAFVAAPLPWKILALGVGVQGVWREQATPGGTFENADAAFGKFSLGLSVPLMRWVPGLAVGLQYSRLFSGVNDLASRVNSVDLALSWRANRYASLALVARNLNAPRLGTAMRATPVLDPELALRPLGDGRLEFAIGARFRPDGFVPESQVRGFWAQPRARVLAGARGVRVYAEAEYVAYYDLADEEVGAFAALRLSTGVQFDAPHFGAAVGPIAAWGTRSAEAEGPSGASGRLRLSRERYDEVLPVRPRRVTRISLAGKASDRELAQVVWTIDELARRGGGVILVELRGTGFGFAQLEEVREALLRLRDAGGKVAVYLEGASLRHYFLASVADRIFAHPREALSITGLATRTLYWGELLARLGVRAEFVRIAEYKGTPEQYDSAGPSAPVAEANRILMTDTWNHLVRAIGRARARDPAVVSGWIDAAPWQPADAQKRGIVDELAWPDQLDAKLEAWLGRRVRIEAPPGSPARDGIWGDPAHVAILHVSGSLVAGESLSLAFLGLELAGSDTLTKEIEGLREDRDVKAIVVRIDSRGGSVRAAREIARELDLTRARKPVVISMGRVAASGGYYVASAGDYIYANATTITGSIGIFLPKLDLTGLLDKVGVNAELLSIGDRATMFSYWKPYSDDERAAAMAGIQGSYDLFIERVAAARAMTPREADALARGRIWSGARAIEVGLVDRYGGLHEAVDRAARMADMPARAGAGAVVRHYPAPPTIVQKIRGLFGLDLSLPLGRGGLGVGAEGGASLAVDPLTGRALGFADPIVRALRSLPAAMWHASGPEPLAIGPCDVEIDG